MPGRDRQLRMRDPDVFLLLSATPFVHRHPHILRTIPVDHISFYFTYPDLHHGLLGVFAQDSWRVVPRLTLTYGLRWDVDFAPSSTSGPSLLAVTGFNLND